MGATADTDGPNSGPDNHFGALGQKLLRGGGGLGAAIAFIGGHQKDVAVAGIEHRQLRRLQHRCGQGAGGGRAAGEGQDDADPHRGGAVGQAGQAQIAGLVLVQRIGGDGALAAPRSWAGPAAGPCGLGRYRRLSQRPRQWHKSGQDAIETASDNPLTREPKPLDDGG